MTKIDIGADPKLRDRLGIRSVPLYKRGKELARLDQRTKKRLVAALDAHLK